MGQTLLLLVLFSLLALVLTEEEQAGGIRCWAYQEGNGIDAHPITCPTVKGSESVCVSYIARDVGNLFTTTCVSQENCDIMTVNPQIYGDVKCCNKDNCNNPNSVGNLSVHLAALLGLIGLILL